MCSYYTTHIASLLIVPSHIPILQNTKWRRYLGQLTKINRPIYERSRHENLERTHNWCSVVGKVVCPLRLF